jgi:acid phosphatase type 7
MAAGAVVVLASVAPARAELEKGPYLQNLQPEGVTVMWHVEPPAPGRVIVEGPGLAEGGKAFDAPEGRIGEVVITGLRPATRYRYRVAVGPHADRGEFATAPVRGSQAPFSFLVFGDNGTSGEYHRRVIAQAITDVPDFVVGTGDAVLHGGNKEEWQNLFAIERPLLRDNAIYPTLGNHDRQGADHNITNYRTFFSLPENSPRPEAYYAFTYGNSRFIVLDSNTASFALTAQTAWLESQLVEARQDPGIRHVFVSMHHPPYSVATHGGQKNLRERWTPLYEKYGVAAVFSGHDHVYQRAEADGIRYFVSGGGGAGTYPRNKKAAAADRAAVKVFERVHHYLRVTIHGDLIEVTAIRADGTIIETTEWDDPRAEMSPTLVAQPAVARTTEPPPAAAVGAPHAAALPARKGGLALLGVAGGVAAALAAILFVVALRRRDGDARSA